MQAQWFAVMGNNPSRFNQKSHCPETHMDVKGQSLCSKNPVESVSWSEIQEFIAKLNANSPDHSDRLPTEAEWEYAVRAGTGTPYSFSENTYGNQVAFLPAYAGRAFLLAVPCRPRRWLGAGCAAAKSIHSPFTMGADGAISLSNEKNNLIHKYSP